MNSIPHGTINGYTNHGCRCDECRKASARYQKARINARRDAYFADKACIVCGSQENLHNHHRDPSTKGKNFNTVWGWAQDKREAELAKCDVLCKGCHTTLHNKERLMPIIHGTLNAYSHRVCRCELCCKAWREYQNAYHKRKRAETPVKPPRQPEPIKHGTYYAYVRYKCRCGGCREASAAYARDRERKIRQSMKKSERSTEEHDK